MKSNKYIQKHQRLDKS